MICLFIDTTFKDVSIALVEDNTILASINKSIPNEHSIYTVSFIDDVLKEAKKTPDMVDRILVVNGPGSFTGVRIGVTIAKTYAYLLKKDIVPVSSLKILALGYDDEYILSLIDAKHDNYYLALYDSNYNEIISEQFNNISKVREIIDKYHPRIVSNQEMTIDDMVIEKRELDIVQIVNYYKDVKGMNVHLVNPNYLKLPQAMEEINDKRS